jgi:hypothetical protein
VNLIALANGLAVAAPAAGAQPLRAVQQWNTTPPTFGLGAWERFYFEAV